MSTDNDVARSLRSWLRENRHEDADRVLDVVFDQVPATPQRRAFRLAPRFFEMNAFARFAAIAAVVVIVALIGFQLIRGSNVGRPPSPTAIPTATPEATPIRMETLSAGTELQSGSRYSTSLGATTVTFVAPASGWMAQEGGFTGHTGSRQETNVRVYSTPSGHDTSPPGIFTDPCAHTGLQQFEHSAAGEAAGYAALAGVSVVAPPTDVSVGGRTGSYVAVVIPTDPGCPNSDYWLYHDELCGVKLGCTLYPTWLGETIRDWIIDLDGGTRFSIQFEVRHSDAGATLDEEIQQLVGSVRVE